MKLQASSHRRAKRVALASLAAQAVIALALLTAAAAHASTPDGIAFHNHTHAAVRVSVRCGR